MLQLSCSKHGVWLVRVGCRCRPHSGGHVGCILCCRAAVLFLSALCPYKIELDIAQGSVDESG